MKSIQNGNISDDDNFDWGSEDEREIANIPLSCSEASSSCSKIIDHFIGMGFAEKLVVKVIREHGEDNQDVILETLLTYSALEESPEERAPESSPEEPALESSPEEHVPESSPEAPKIEPDDFLSDYEGSLSSGFSDTESFSENEEAMNPTVLSLVDMGYTKVEASIALERCGAKSSISELTDFIFASQMAKENDAEYPLEVHPRPESKKRRFGGEMLDKKKQRKRILNEDEDLIRPPKPMIGYGVPFDSFQTVRRTIPEAAQGPPYFYYENVALAPKGVWTTISRFLYDVEPEFVDSKYFCAANRKRGYIHNLPIENRFPLLPAPPLTINEALPLTKRWWPNWDKRTKLNCIQTAMASSRLTERLRKILENYGDENPPEKVQTYVLEECRRWNLVWVGKNRLAPLEPDEVESILGFPRNYTRGGGMSRTDRYKSLGNSFQLDTVAYHLSVLKEMYPNGINILSLFSGIGGAEVALHRLGIRLKNVVSVEISEVNRNMVRCWWEQTNQTGNLYDLADVQRIDSDYLESVMSKFGGFDLVIGGSPCNNLAGGNRVHRNGLEGKESSLFFDYFRILDLVRGIMATYQ